MSKLAYYAHSLGSGHCRYADFVSSLVPGGITVFTASEHDTPHAARRVELEEDYVADDILRRHLTDTPPYLHYSPVGLPAIRRRALRMLSAIEEEGIDVVIVDVGVEVAAFFRTASVPYLYVRMFGRRDDLPHLSAYHGAMGLLAYYPEAMEDPETPRWVRKKTTYLGFKPYVGSANGRVDRVPRLPGHRPGRPVLCFVKGFGGARELDEAIVRIHARFPCYYTIGLGDFPEPTGSLLDQRPGVVSDVTGYLRVADIVVGACGSNLTAEVITLGKPFIPLPCARPYGEQEAIAKALFRHGLALPLGKFLAGESAPLPDDATRSRFAGNAYRSYFGELSRAADWREVLKPELLSTKPALHET